MMKAVIAVVVVLVVVAGIVVLQNRGEATGAQPGSVNNVSVTPPNANPEQQPVFEHPESHVIYCAEPDYLEDKFTNKEGIQTVVLEKGHASEGVAVTFLRSPKWLKQCPLDADHEKEDKLKETAGKVPGLAVYNFNVERAGTYFVFLNAKWTDTCGNSCWILMNGPEKGGHGPEAGDYHMIKDQNGFKTEKDYEAAWHAVMNNGQQRKYELKAGPNRIEIHTRQDGPTFYQLVVSTDYNMPIGKWVKKKS
ncbi:MAG TPA: hypothetical protein VKX17_06620 [Planctomycetota bacterium]|nr:hypothetical protein [Planctomycetota bacterium]